MEVLLGVVVVDDDGLALTPAESFLSSVLVVVSISFETIWVAQIRRV